MAIRAAFERTVARALGLEHPANVYPLMHVGAYYTSLALLVWPGAVTAPIVRGALWVLLVLFNYSVAIGVFHLHAHRKVFLRAPGNRMLDLLLCFPSLVTGSEVNIFHVRHHHSKNNGEEDAASTRSYERGWRAVWYWLRYPGTVRCFTVARIYGPGAHGSLARHRFRFAFDLGVASSFVVALAIMCPRAFVVCWLVPAVVTWVTAGYFAWLTHGPAGEPGSIDASINTVNNWMGLFIFNQGYHQVHHCHPGIHWSEIPDRLEMMLRVDPRYIVPYWVTLPSAWRIVRYALFHHRDFGERWQARYREKATAGRVRFSLCPHFAWI